MDGTIDNQLGNIQTAIVQAGGAELEQSAVDRGTILWLAAGVACPGTCLETYTGSNPAPSPCSGPGDTVCRHHLDGTGSFDASFDPAHPRLGGTSSGTTYDATGTVRIPLVVFAGPPAWVHLRRAHGHLTAVGAEWSGKVGGAITEAEVQSEVFPAIHTGIADQIAADCTGSPPPGCGCTSNTLGASYLGMFDENLDCTVTLDEVRTHTMMTTLFRPDIDLDGDGTLDAISAGVHVTTVGASFALP